MGGELRTRGDGLPKRSNVHPVGKLVGYRLYFHKQYAHLFPSLGPKLAWAMRIANAAHSLLGYTCLRWDTESNSISFQWSPDFDTADEPVVTKTITVKMTSQVNITTPAKLQIWHHKWLWVRDDYQGFDVEASKARSLLWAPHVSAEEKRKIGYLKYWDSIRHRWEKKA